MDSPTARPRQAQDFDSQSALAFRLCVAPREKGRPYQREGYRVLSARLIQIQRRAHPCLVIVKRFPCLASLPQELRAATPPGRAVSAWCLSWLVV